MDIDLLSEIVSLSAPLYFMFSLIIPVIIIAMMVRGYNVDRILVDKALKKRLRWTAITLIFYLLFNEIECIGAAVGMEYNEFVMFRRPIGALAILSGFMLVNTLIPIIKRYEFSKRMLATIDNEKRKWQYVVCALVFVLFVSPFFPERLMVSMLFTASIGILLVLNLYFMLYFTRQAGMKLTDMTNQEQLKWLSGCFVAMTFSPVFNVITILLNLPPAANVLRIPFTLILLYCAYRASQYFIELRRPEGRLPD